MPANVGTGLFRRTWRGASRCVNKILEATPRLRMVIDKGLQHGISESTIVINSAGRRLDPQQFGKRIAMRGPIRRSVVSVSEIPRLPHI